MVQSIVTFIIGVILASHGIPSSPTDFIVKFGDSMATNISSMAPSDVSDTAQSMVGIIELMGYTISFVSLIEFFIVSIYLLISVIVSRVRPQKP